VKIKYVTIATDTLAGLKLAEKYHNNGWKTVRACLFSITFAK